MSERRVEHDIFGTAPRPKGINQKQKGNLNERVAAKFLSEWTGAKFNRTPSSGGMHLKNQLFCGDLVCITEDFWMPFVVETKHLKTFHVTYQLRANSKVFTVFAQAKRDADRIGKRPLCLIRSNGMKAGDYVLILPSDICARLHRHAALKGIVALIGEGESMWDGTELRGWLASDLRKAYSWRKFVSLLGLTGSKTP